MLYVSPLKALAVDVERNLRAPLAGISNVARSRGDEFIDSRDRHPHRRHAAVGARQVRARSGRHPHHHARVALSDDDLERARHAARRRDGHHRRDPRARAEQARRAHGAVAGAAGHAVRASRRSGSGFRRRSGRWKRWRDFLGGAAEPARSSQLAALRRTGDGRRPASHAELAELRARSSVPSRSSTPAKRSSSRCASKSPSRTWRALAETSRSRAVPPRSGRAAPSIWPAIHPRLLELIRSHTSTLIFVNSRRLAERLAAALNELAGETLVQRITARSPARSAWRSRTR